MAGPHGRAPAGIPPQIADAVQEAATAAQVPVEQRPEWLDAWLWRALWKVVAVGLATALLLGMAWRIKHLLWLLVVALFFALAMIPAVSYVHQRWRWRRGAAVGLIYGGTFASVIIMVLLLIPGIVTFADRLRSDGRGWLDRLNSLAERWFGTTIVQPDTADSATNAAQSALANWGDNILGFASAGIGLLFDLSTVAMFAFYLAADYPRIERALLSRMPPHRQQLFSWVMETSIRQTGGYLYSRIILMVINGSLFFVAMLVVGVPLVFALPLSVFEGFVSEFIPAIGTYLGAAVPILVTVGVTGFGAALVLVIWTIIYQQVENMVLSPRLSARTMQLNGAIAFGSALAGGAIAGPMGAFMALPVAALITALIKNTGKTYAIIERLADETAPEAGDPRPRIGGRRGAGTGTGMPRS